MPARHWGGESVGVVPQNVALVVAAPQKWPVFADFDPFLRSKSTIRCVFMVNIVANHPPGSVWHPCGARGAS
jgi:hypothetical protein